MAYCCQNRRYWLIIQQENYFFSQPECRYLYQLLHNYYTANPHLEFNFDEPVAGNNNTSLKEKIHWLQEIVDEDDNLQQTNSFVDFFKLFQTK